MTAPLYNRVPAAEFLGTEVRGKVSLAEVLDAAGMNCQVNEVSANSLFVNDGEDLVSTSVPSRKLLMRSDNQITLGLVGLGYHPVDNAEAFALADDAKVLGATFAYAGEYDHGRKAFLSMDIPEARIAVGGLDYVDFSIVMRTDHAGNGAINGEIMANRLVCTNGQTITSSQAKWSIRHTRNADTRMDLAREAVQHAFISAKEFAAQADALISTPMSEQDYINMLNMLFIHPDENSTQRQHTIWQRRFDELMYLFREAETQEEGRGTAWGGLQSILEWDQYYRPARGGEEGRARRNFNTPDNANLGARTLRLLRV